MYISMFLIKISSTYRRYMEGFSAVEYLIFKVGYVEVSKSWSQNWTHGNAITFYVDIILMAVEG